MKKILTAALLFVSINVLSQSVGIGTLTPDASAQLDISSTTQGFLIPRLTLVQRNLVAGPATGLMIYQTDNTPGLYTYNGASWQPVSTAGGSLSLPYSSLYGGSSTAFEVDMIGGSNNTGIKSVSYNTGSKAFFGEARGNNSIAGYFTVAGTPTGAASLQTDVGDVYLTATSGNVGIGLTGASVTEKLHVNGNMKIGNAVWSAGNDRILKFGDGNFVTIGEAGQDDRMTLTGRNFIFTPSSSYPGYIGINTTTPASPLSFGNIIGEKINLWNTDATHNYGIGVQGGLLQIHSNDVASEIAFGYGSSSSFSEFARVSNTVGVQTGGTNAGFWFKDRTLNTYSGWNWYADNGNANLYLYGFGNALTVDQSGNLGIGNSTPGAKLDIAGNIKIADGNQLAGRVLMTDNDGLATWADLPSANGGFRERAGFSFPIGGTGVEVVIPFTFEEYDQTNSFSGSNFTIPVTGVYHFDASIRWTLTAVGTAYRIGGTIYTSGSISTPELNYLVVPAGYAGEFTTNLSIDGYFFAGDQVKVQASQNSGTSQTIGSFTIFDGHRIN
jgi:hypothetical protein